MSKTYFYPQETWNYETCLKKSKSRTNMGYDAPEGYIGRHYGATSYNGGKLIDGKLYNSDYHTLPIIDDNFELEFVGHWGWFIRLKASK